MNSAEHQNLGMAYLILQVLDILVKLKEIADCRVQSIKGTFHLLFEKQTTSEIPVLEQRNPSKFVLKNYRLYIRYK